MNFEKLNSLAAVYYSAPSSEALRSLYDEAANVFRRDNQRKILATRLGDENDADELFDAAILKLSRRPAMTNFGGYLSITLKNARRDFVKTTNRYRHRYQLSLDEEVEDAPTFEPTSGETAEDEYLALQRKKEIDQRQLIDFLVNDHTQVDCETTLIVSQFSQYSSITALAKALGMHHEYVKRKLRRLSRRYDVNRFGDYSEYLAV